MIVDVHNTLVNNAVLRWANEEQKRRWLPRLASDTVGAYALSEAGSGSDAFALAARAVEDGDAYVLNGRKLWITNAAEAGIFLVFATVNPDGGYKGITCFVVERGARRIQRRQEGRQTRHSRFVHLRTVAGRCARGEARHSGRSWQRLQDRHRDSE